MLQDTCNRTKLAKIKNSNATFLSNFQAMCSRFFLPQKIVKRDYDAKRKGEATMARLKT